MIESFHHPLAGISCVKHAKAGEVNPSVHSSAHHVAVCVIFPLILLIYSWDDISPPIFAVSRPRAAAAVVTRTSPHIPSGSESRLLMYVRTGKAPHWVWSVTPWNPFRSGLDWKEAGHAGQGRGYRICKDRRRNSNSSSSSIMPRFEVI